VVSGLHDRCAQLGAHDYTRECLAVEVDTSLGGVRVARVLEELKQRRGLPRRIRSDNGPEFGSRAVDQWAYEPGLQWHTIRPGRPTDNGYVESFNGRFRDKCLNENWFGDLVDAREKITQWSGTTTIPVRTAACSTVPSGVRSPGCGLLKG
jgi:putative transposase